MPLFETGIVQVNASVGSISSLIWQPSCTSTTTFGGLGSITTGDTLKDVTIINTGAGTIYVGGGSGLAAAVPLGMQIPPGGQATVQGYAVTSGTSTLGNIWAQAATGATPATSSSVVGLASVPSVV